ncbi:MAG TPA: glycoside hydrolase family 127 protein [Sphaerochaeta sp.]|nr:glycoside hydrolase family 127 protein [Sphaerochaeta sp.]
MFNEAPYTTDPHTVKVTDPLFSHYVELISTVVIPYQWEILNDRVEGAAQSHCLENFRIAAGLSEGSYYGQVFQDTDLYKWLEALAFCLMRGKASPFEAVGDEAIAIIEQAQMPDGYLHTYHILGRVEARWTNLLEAHELYSAGHLIEAAIAYHQATGKDRLLRVAIRFADLICRTFGPADHQIHGYPGHEEIELALIKLYRHTGERRYLDTARYFLDTRGTEPNYFTAEIERRNGVGIYHEFGDYDLSYSQSHMPPVEQRDAEGHAVRALYLYSAMADLAEETGDEAYRTACEALYRSITERRMYITGSVGSSGHLERFTTDYDLPNDRNYSESCASVALMMFASRMARLTGDAHYHDTVERALFNTVLAGISADGLHYFYVNPLEVWPPACMDHTSMAHVKATRQRWFECACCPANIARTLANLGHYIYASDASGPVINQLIASEVVVKTEDGDSLLSLEVPQPSRTVVIVRASTDLPVAVRLPWYAEEPTFTENGKIIDVSVSNGYAHLSLQGGVPVQIDLHVEGQWMMAHPQVHADQGRIALQYGPFVYCLEEVDNGAQLGSIAIDTNEAVTVVDRLPTLPGNMEVLGYRGQRIGGDEGGPLYQKATFSTQETTVRAVPYCLWGNRENGEMLVFQHLGTI